MLEEFKMDKKSSNRSAQPQSRAPAIDCKKSSDLTHKPWPRNNKKREGASSAPKNEPSRRNAPSHRGRGQVDRRPRPRGDTGYAVGGAQITRLEEDDEPEIGSVFVPGSKKQNLNHLLNFMYPTRGQDRGPGANGGLGPQRRPAQQYFFKHEQDLYLRAYCQFVVKEDGDYKLNLLDPDVPIKWEQIEEVVVRSPGRSECPICIGAPVAGRVGLCGHVYCWPCVLHYAAAHEKQPPPCPVCATPLLVNDMKPTKMVQWDSPAEETYQDMKQNCKRKHTLERRAAISTGGGPPLTDSTDPFDTIVSKDALNGFGVESDVVFKVISDSHEEVPIVIEKTDSKETVDGLEVMEVPIAIDKRTAPQQRLDRSLAMASNISQRQKIKMRETELFRSEILSEMRVLNGTLKQLLEVIKTR